MINMSEARRLTAACLLAGGTAAAAQGLEEIEVIGVTPAEGVGIDRNRIAAHVQRAGAEDLERSNALDLADFMSRSLGSVSINSAQNNPLQPDVQYRGFTASPLLGLPQGLAVYQDGVRINEPLGDAVNWDLLPESAINSITLTGGANPVFGLNTLGGALAIDMKNGFNFEGHQAEVYGGSWDRVVVGGESGGNNGTWGYYANVQYFEESGWRDLSDSDALNFYGALSWRSERSSLDFSYQRGESELIGNGASPVGLLAIDRDAVFTAPDITENDMDMVNIEATHFFNDDIQFSGNAFWRENRTESFNGDASEFVECNFAGGAAALLEIEEDDVEDELGLELDDLCDGSNPAITSVADLENLLETTALGLGLDPEEFEPEDLSGDLSGSGVLSDAAINNQSQRRQESYGTNLQLSFLQDLLGRDNSLTVGYAFFQGDSTFDAVLELAGLDPVTRSTAGLGTGTFVDAEATNVETMTRSWSLYFTDTFAITEQLALTLAGRYNSTHVEVSDVTGTRPELNGRHDYDRFNPSVGLTFTASESLNLYGSYNEASRAPTPIELSCNDETAARFELRTGEDDFECRLPNAFLADPPLEQVVTKSFEFGARGDLPLARYHLGYFRSTNTDDILFQTTGRATGLFANVDKTRRQGIEGSLNGELGKLTWRLNYTWLEATFQDDFLALSPEHPFSNDEGEIQVSDGDDIPGIPDHQLKFGGDYRFENGLVIGGDLIYNSGQFLRGDESNQLDKLDGYAIVNLRAAWRFSPRFEVFVRGDNVFDKNYENFGLLGEDPGEVISGLADDRPFFLGAGAPRAGWVGVRVRL